ncbi:hypothetical protein [Streptomyces sp. NPDC001927]
MAAAALIAAQCPGGEPSALADRVDCDR